MVSRLRDTRTATDPKKRGASVQLAEYHKWIAAHYLYLRKQMTQLDALEKAGEVWGVSISAVGQCVTKYKADADVQLRLQVDGLFEPYWVTTTVRGTKADQSCLAQMVRMFRDLGDPQKERLQVERLRLYRSKKPIKRR